LASDDRDTARFEDRYPREALGESAPSGGFTAASVWGAPPEHTDEADTAQEPAATPETVVGQEAENPDTVDTTPTRMPTREERDPLTDTGRHARIVIDEPAPNGTALHLPLDDPDEAPDGYPIKADTKSGLYWVPGSTLYDDARAEIWFASEELARTNGFVRAN
jgi:uncharacterized protein with LGFP repeats